MLYGEFLQHIYQKYSGNVKLELDRMIGILQEMDHPQKSFRGLHIAGTNGKGSVCATLESLSLAYGFQTGLNTSPHLIDYTERFRINGIDTDFDTILRIFHANEELFDRWDASFFEITTSIAFELFRRNKIHTGIIEVGLGGRLDATNLFTPDVCAITTIGLDHIKTLGPTQEIIAAEKAGILKTGIPVVLGAIEASPLNVILDIADQRQVPCYLFGQDYHVSIRENSIDGIRFDYRFGDFHFPDLKANLIGEHQSRNISIAITAFILYLQARKIEVNEELIRRAVSQIRWAGRMQLLQNDPCVILDGAHNVQGIEALIHNVHSSMQGKKIRFVVSILADKDYAKMLSMLCGVADIFYIAQNESDRAATIEQQSKVIAAEGIPFQTAGSVAEAYQLALNDSAKDDIIIAGGSLYTVGEILQYHGKTRT